MQKAYKGFGSGHKNQIIEKPKELNPDNHFVSKLGPIQFKANPQTFNRVAVALWPRTTSCDSGDLPLLASLIWCSRSGFSL